MLSSKTTPVFVNMCSLIAEMPGYDDIGNAFSVKQYKEVYCAEFPVPQSEFYAAAQAGIKSEIGIIVNSFEFGQEKKAKYGNKEYSVYRIFPRADGMTELYLTRGE